KYQMRAPAPPGNRLVSGRDGAALFSNKCGYCHLVGGMGTNLLTKLRAPDHLSGLLAERTDLKPDYVKYVVRNGYLAMPRISRAEVTNAELDAIARYLAKGNK
ncbi:MAG: c-type cytochrome, partial [Alphaproteobacteria bacterium]|nr:c-type cytochrome [Alphaproteobacteria bacterium]